MKGLRRRQWHQAASPHGVEGAGPHTLGWDTFHYTWGCPSPGIWNGAQ